MNNNRFGLILRVLAFLFKEFVEGDAFLLLSEVGGTLSPASPILTPGMNYNQIIIIDCVRDSLHICMKLIVYVTCK